MITAIDMNDGCPHCGAPVLNLPTGPYFTCACMKKTGRAKNAPTQPQQYEKVLEQQVAELLTTLCDLVEETCMVDTVLDSNVRIAKTRAIQLLSRYEKVKITGEAGRRVIAKWI